LRDANRLFIASDSNADGLLDTAWKTTRKPARGGISNLLCIAEPLDILSKELGNVADRVTVILPWGSLLRAVAAPEVASLLQIASLCSSDASIEVVFSCDPQCDAGESARLGISHTDERHIKLTLPELYRQAGLRIVAAAKLPQRELSMYETAWAKRLATGRPRDVWRFCATRKE